MIGVGVDLCEIARIERALQRGNRFLQRFYAPEEREYIARQGARAAQSAAAMFAAKEAFLKAMGSGIGAAPLREIAVCHAPEGRPYLCLTGKAATLLKQSGGSRLHLSLTHEAGMAAAVVVAE